MTPRILSVQQIVENDGAFFSQTLMEGAALTLNGVEHCIPIKHGVPLLALSALIDVDKSD